MGEVDFEVFRSEGATLHQWGVDESTTNLKIS